MYLHFNQYVVQLQRSKWCTVFQIMPFPTCQWVWPSASCLDACASVTKQYAVYLTSRFTPFPTPVITAGPFPGRATAARFKRMGFVMQWNVCLHWYPDRITHCFLPVDQTWWWSTASTHCRRGFCWLAHVIWHLDAYNNQKSTNWYWSMHIDATSPARRKVTAGYHQVYTNVT